MTTGEIIAGIITVIIALATAAYAVLAIFRKGPILSNTYLWLSKDEKKRADKEAEYKLITVVFGLIAASFALLAVYIFTDGKAFLIAAFIVLAVNVIYAISESVKTEKSKVK